MRMTQSSCLLTKVTKTFKKKLTESHFGYPGTMSLAAEKCCCIAFKGQSLSLTMNKTTLEQSAKVTDLGVQLTGTLKAAKHLESRLATANRNFGFLKRNLSKNMETRVKIYAYKSLILPLITFASSTWHPSRGIMRLMECFQKRALK